MKNIKIFQAHDICRRCKLETMPKANRLLALFDKFLFALKQKRRRKFYKVWLYK